ncbi:hypothetical protein [Jiella avicenniae]|uniref:Uncharacterized protein n=1 Tax=Jiella avicenniae TaxID=2907202 RepID=A0A9X1P5J5_9HYPH|nr:hypothetical protein [Jiella avicenniae]MCE7030856.1 hypothetical protein [Jiella avicenniae]
MKGIARSLSVAGLLIFLYGCFHQLALSLVDFPIVRTASAIEGASSFPEVSASTIDSIRSEIREGRACGGAFHRGRVTLSMFVAEWESQRATIAEERLSALEAAAQSLRDALRCSPEDGNLWSVLAFVERSIALEPNRFTAMMRLSTEASPVDARVLTQRWLLLAPLLRLPGVSVGAEFDADLNRALLLTKPRTALDITAVLRANGSTELAEQSFLALPDARIEELTQIATGARSTFGRGERYRTFDFRPFNSNAD